MGDQAPAAEGGEEGGERGRKRGEGGGERGGKQKRSRNASEGGRGRGRPPGLEWTGVKGEARGGFKAAASARVWGWRAW